MSISQALLPEFDQEVVTTRKVLARVPEDKFGWKPHEKSMTAGRLASHIAEMGMWGSMTMSTESFDFAPGGVNAFPPANFATQAESETPTIVLFVNDINLLHFSYRRYLEKKLRERFGFQGNPLRLVLRQEKK